MKRLFNPFEKFTEKQLLLFGMLATVVGVAIAWLFKARFDGALDVHYFEQVTLLQTVTDLVTDIVTLLLFLWIASRFINRKTRVIDLLSAIIIARIPFYILPLFNCTGWMTKMGTELEEQFKSGQVTWVPGPGELVLIIFFALVMILLLVWAIALLYNGYRVATNAKGAKAVIVFIAALFLAETFSKIVLYCLDTYAFKNE